MRSVQVTWIIWTGHESAASFTTSSIFWGASPSAILPTTLYIPTTWLNVSSGFCSKKSGQIVQQFPQLIQSLRSILTLTIQHTECLIYILCIYFTLYSTFTFKKFEQLDKPILKNPTILYVIKTKLLTGGVYHLNVHEERAY